MRASSPSAASPSTTGTTRRRSSSAGTGAAPGRVDSPPTSTIAAPSSTSRRAWRTASASSSNVPPSENESGVTLTTPMIWNGGIGERTVTNLSLVGSAPPTECGGATAKTLASPLRTRPGSCESSDCNDDHRDPHPPRHPRRGAHGRPRLGRRRDPGLPRRSRARDRGLPQRLRRGRRHRDRVLPGAALRPAGRLGRRQRLVAVRVHRERPVHPDELERPLDRRARRDDQVKLLLARRQPPADREQQVDPGAVEIGDVAEVDDQLLRLVLHEPPQLDRHLADARRVELPREREDQRRVEALLLDADDRAAHGAASSSGFGACCRVRFSTTEVPWSAGSTSTLSISPRISGKPRPRFSPRASRQLPRSVTVTTICPCSSCASTENAAVPGA